MRAAEHQSNGLLPCSISSIQISVSSIIYHPCHGPGITCLIIAIYSGHDDASRFALPCQRSYSHGNPTLECDKCVAIVQSSFRIELFRISLVTGLKEIRS